MGQGSQDNNQGRQIHRIVKGEQEQGRFILIILMTDAQLSIDSREIYFYLNPFLGYFVTSMSSKSPNTPPKNHIHHSSSTQLSKPPPRAPPYGRSQLKRSKSSSSSSSNCRPGLYWGCTGALPCPIWACVNGSIGAMGAMGATPMAGLPIGAGGAGLLPGGW